LPLDIFGCMLLIDCLNCSILEFFFAKICMGEFGSLVLAWDYVDCFLSLSVIVI
jgi:hypothetical protein